MAFHQFVRPANARAVAVSGSPPDPPTDAAQKPASGVPTIHCIPDELSTARLWHEHLEPIARAAGVELPDYLEMDGGDPAAHLLKAPDGRLLAVVRTDRPACPTCGR